LVSGVLVRYCVCRPRKRSAAEALVRASVIKPRRAVVASLRASDALGTGAKQGIAFMDLCRSMARGRVQSRTHRPVGERPTEAKRLRPRSWGGAVARKQDGGALRQHARKGVCATHQVATCSERRRSLVTRISGG
jgi:hypothetical protein